MLYTPKISVIIPTYNWVNFIENSLNSVLNQTLKDIEIIITDDWSTDETQTLLKDLQKVDSRIKILLNENNLWISWNTNRGISSALWDLIANLDQDDERIDPDKLKNQYSYIKNKPNLWILWTWYHCNYFWKDIYEVILPASDRDIKSTILNTCPILHSSSVYRKEIVSSFWWYSSKYKASPDKYLFFEILKRSEWENLPDITTLYNIREWNTSNENNLLQSIESLKLSFANRSYFPNFYNAIFIRLWLVVWNSTMHKICPELKPQVKNILKKYKML